MNPTDTRPTPKPTLQRLVVPLALSLTLLCGAFAAALITQHQQHLQRQGQENLQQVLSSLNQKIKSQSATMGTVTRMILRHDELPAQLKGGDREALLKGYQALFDDLRQTSGIGYLSFHTSDRINLLRVHEPERFGDPVSRFSLMEAERTQVEGGGLEADSQGHLLLRLVQPVMERGRPVGYLELGTRIEYLLGKLPHERGVELALLTHAEHQGEARAGANQRPAITYSSLNPLPEALDAISTEATLADLQWPREIRFGDAKWLVMPEAIRDTSAARQATLVVLSNLSAAEHGLLQSMGWPAAWIVLLVAALFVALIILLRKTDREIRAQQATLLASEERSRKLFDHLAEGHCLCNAEGRVIEVNARLLDLLGYRREEVLGHPITEFSTPGSGQPGDPGPPFGSSLLTGPIRVEGFFKRRAGERFPGEVTASMITAAGERLTHLTLRDTTESTAAAQSLVESEEKFRAIFHSSTIGMIMVSSDGETIADWNIGAEHAFGYSAEEAVGKPLSMLIPERYRERHATGMARARREGRLIHGEVVHEFHGRKKDGQEFPIELSLASWKKGGEIHFSAMVFDTSSRKRTEQVLRRSQKMDAVGQLTGGVAHDFNNLLSIILGNLDFLKMQVANDEKVLKRVTTIEKTALRATDLTRQLLGFSRRKAAQLVITDISRVVREMEDLIARAVTPQIAVELDLCPTPWPTEIDPGDFQDSLLNLVINARDAMPEGGQLTIETRNRTLDQNYCHDNPGAIPGHYVELVVSDSGEGIPNDRLEHIFEPFFTTKTADKGTGLGLPMVYGFIQRSKGFINVYSEVNSGSAFRLYLPRSERAEQPLSTAAPLAAALPTGNEKILVVDDEEGLLELAQSMLEAQGYRVVTATNGQEALDTLGRESDISLLFSDVVMPGGISGDELATQATANHPELKVLLTSGFTGKALNGTRSSLAQRELLAKPYSREELARGVRALLDGRPAGDREAAPPAPLAAPPPVVKTGWTEALSIGVDLMDEDHRGLLSLLARSQQSSAEGNFAETREVIEQLRLYSERHFEREEKIMAACGYPGLRNHKQVHRILIKEIEKRQSQLQRDEIGPAELEEFINSWWVDHIQVMDRAYAPYCEKNEALIRQTLEEEPPQEGEASP